MPLPAFPYETAVWSTATIQPDYLMTVENCKYSVPYEFIGKKVDIRSTENSIEIFYHGQRIASHVRKLYASEPLYIPEHMPENHRKFLEYNTESFLEWGKAMGHSTLLVIKHFLFMHKVEQQGYKSCASLMKLADRYGTERLENACAKALSYTPNPSLKNISTILKNGQDGRVPVYPAVFLSLFSAFCTIILTSCLEFPLIQKWDSLRQFRIPASAYDTGLP